MKRFLLICCIAALIVFSSGVRIKKRRRITTQRPIETTTEEIKIVDTVNTREALFQDETELTGNEISYSSDFSAQDPCLEKRCGPGRECISTSTGKARCVCLDACPAEEDDRRRVCSNYNETWISDCELYRSRCLCDAGSPECLNPLNKHLHIEYYGECREIQACTEEEMVDFPRRMRDWLFNVMRELADRRELSPHYLQMEREAERKTDEAERSVVAAIWKWCDLDGHPHDRQVSRHELFPIRAPLMALEHCIAPFLDGCDADDDHRITLKEWGACLNIPKDQMLDKCEDVSEALRSDKNLNDEGDEEV